MFNHKHHFLKSKQMSDAIFALQHQSAVVVHSYHSGHKPCAFGFKRLQSVASIHPAQIVQVHILVLAFLAQVGQK